MAYNLSSHKHALSLHGLSERNEKKASRTVIWPRETDPSSLRRTGIAILGECYLAWKEMTLIGDSG